MKIYVEVFEASCFLHPKKVFKRLKVENSGMVRVKKEDTVASIVGRI